MEITAVKLSNKILFIMIISCFTLLFSQEIGMRKSLNDDQTGQNFNNFRTDSTEAVFYQILKSDEFIYNEPKNNATAVYSLDSDTFVESVQEADGGKFIKIRVLDKFHGIIEGWVRSTTLAEGKYYGQSFSKYKKLPKNEDSDKKVNPHWVKDKIQVVYSDSLMSGPAMGTLKIGDIVFVEKISADSICPVYFSSKEGSLSRGFMSKFSLSELALLENSSSDFSTLFKKYDPVLLKNDVDKACFISYSGVDFSNKDSKEFTEDKVCKEKTNDSLYYRYSLSTNVNDIKKKLDVKKRFDKANIAMYRFLPDESIIARIDTIRCSVLEFVNIPKTAKISMNGMEDSSITNTLTKLYITHLEKFDMDIVFHRETTQYIWTYTKNITSGEIVKSNTETEKVIKRMTAFRKH